MHINDYVERLHRRHGYNYGQQDRPIVTMTQWI